MAACYCVVHLIKKKTLVLTHNTPSIYGGGRNHNEEDKREGMCNATQLIAQCMLLNNCKPTFASFYF